jgi:hypothetical protein
MLEKNDVLKQRRINEIFKVRAILFKSQKNFLNESLN